MSRIMTAVVCCAKLYKPGDRPVLQYTEVQPKVHDRIFQVRFVYYNTKLGCKKSSFTLSSEFRRSAILQELTTVSDKHATSTLRLVNGGDAHRSMTLDFAVPTTLSSLSNHYLPRVVSQLHTHFFVFRSRYLPYSFVQTLQCMKRVTYRFSFNYLFHSAELFLRC
jgi:hypothetical protein